MMGYFDGAILWSGYFVGGIFCRGYFDGAILSWAILTVRPGGQFSVSHYMLTLGLHQLAD